MIDGAGFDVQAGQEAHQFGASLHGPSIAQLGWRPQIAAPF
jgi:hypothetical protein